MSNSRERMVDAIIHRLAAGQPEASILAAGYEADVLEWTKVNFADRIAHLRQPNHPETTVTLKPAVQKTIPAAPVVKKTSPVAVSYYKYQGKPVLSFAQGESDRFPLAFGLTKAKKLLAYADENGLEALYAVLKQFVNENSEEH